MKRQLTIYQLISEVEYRYILKDGTLSKGRIWFEWEHNGNKTFYYKSWFNSSVELIKPHSNALFVENN